MLSDVHDLSPLGGPETAVLVAELPASDAQGRALVAPARLRVFAVVRHVPRHDTLQAALRRQQAIRGGLDRRTAAAPGAEHQRRHEGPYADRWHGVAGRVQLPVLQAPEEWHERRWHSVPAPPAGGTVDGGTYRSAFRGARPATTRWHRRHGIASGCLSARRGGGDVDRQTFFGPCREAAGVWDILVMILVVVLQCRSWFHFQFGLWLQPPSFQCGRPRIFWSLPAQPCRAQWETRRLQSAGGLQWVQEKLDWYERTKAYSAFVRSDQSATMASECAGEGLYKGPMGIKSGGSMGGEIWEWVVLGVCDRSGFFQVCSEIAESCERGASQHIGHLDALEPWDDGRAQRPAGPIASWHCERW